MDPYWWFAVAAAALLSLFLIILTAYLVRSHKERGERQTVPFKE